MKVNRREAIGFGIAGSVAGTLGPAVATAATADAAPVTALRVCGLEAPLALGDLVPRLSWRLADARDAQVAWRVTAASTPADLAAGRALLWDSGKVPSTQCLDVAWGGPALPPRAQVVWQVEVWTKNARTPLRSAVATWETGLPPAQWDAQWLAAETAVARADRLAGLHWIAGGSPVKAGASRAYRWTFESAGGPAELCLSAHEITGLWLNGAPLPAPALDPRTWTHMAVHPVTLVRGRNVVAVEVTRRVGFGVPPPVLAALLRHGPALGARATSASPGWKVAADPAQGWQAAAFDDAAWADAAPATGTLPIGEPWPVTPASRLRHAFTAAPARSARLHVTALGVYEARLNGQPVDDRKLAPEFTDPSKRVLCQTYDVTALLRPGPNMLGLEVADGWYGSKFSGSGRFSFGPAPCRVMARLEIEHADGTRSAIVTGPGWQIADSPVLAASLYDGEIFDARADQSDWALPGSTAPGAADTGWRDAETAPAPTIALEPQRCPPIRPHETLQPFALTRIAPGRYVADFGQNFAGWPRLTLTAPVGTRVTLRMAELVHADGTIDQSNLRTALARDIYIAAGTGRETFEPRFTYHGFRYVELEGVPDDPAQWRIEARVGYQDLALTGDFRCGDGVVQRFWQNALRSQKANFFGLPTDCPQRDERLGWMGDAQVFWPAAAYNMDIAAMTARVMEDMRHGQSAKGGFPDCIPPFVPTMAMSSPGWADAGIVLPYTAWRQSGDTGVIHANRAAMEAYMDFILAANPDHVWRKARGADYGDWLAVDAPTANPGAPTTPKDLVATAYWAANATMMAQMARATDDAQGAERHAALFGAIRTAFAAAFVAPDGKVGNDSQTGHVLAIRFGLLDDKGRAQSGRRLAADIARRGNHLSTGFLGTPHILDALAMSGQEALAITLLLQRSYPSWGYMVEQGATSMWERWNSDQGDTGMNSRNHYAFGAIGAFLFRRVAGIEAATPGFGTVRVAPIMDPRLGSGGATYRSVHGPIRTDWTAAQGRFRLDVQLPSGVTGEVHLPGGRKAMARPGANRFSGRI